MLLQNAVAEVDTTDRPTWKCVKIYKSIRKWNSKVKHCRHNNIKDNGLCVIAAEKYTRFYYYVYFAVPNNKKRPAIFLTDLRASICSFLRYDTNPR